MRIEIDKGANIYHAADTAVRKAEEVQDYVQFEFNEIPLEVHWQSWPDDIARIYELKSEIRRLKKGA